MSAEPLKDTVAWPSPAVAERYEGAEGTVALTEYVTVEVARKVGEVVAPETKGVYVMVPVASGVMVKVWGVVELFESKVRVTGLRFVDPLPVGERVTVPT